MSAGCAYYPRRRIAFHVFGVGVVKSSETATRAHLFQYTCQSSTSYQKANKTNLLLVGEAAKMLAIWIPRNEVCEPRTQFWIFLVVRNLPPLEPKASVNPKRLVVEVPEMDGVSEGEGIV